MKEEEGGKRYTKIFEVIQLKSTFVSPNIHRQTERQKRQQQQTNTSRL